MLLVPNGSPYWRGKHDERIAIAVARVAESGLPLVYLNQIGGQDELVFDGALVRAQRDCSLAAQLPAFQSQVTSIAFGARATARGCARTRRRRSCRKATRPITWPAWWACAITSTRTAFPAS